MKNTAICKKYFDMHKTMTKETQFNKKVNLNIEIANFKKLHHIQIVGSEPVLKVFIQNGIYGEIIIQYAKKNNNLECLRIGQKYKLINHENL